VNWALVITHGNNTYTGAQIAPRNWEGNLLNSGVQAPVNVSPGNPISGFTQQTLGGAFALALDMTDFNAFIELLQSQGDVKVLSSPRVSTLHNQKAVIKAGSDEFFVTDISSNTVTGTSSATNRDVELTPFFSGIALDVTPQISEEGNVILHVHPTVSDVTDQTKALTVAGVTDEIPLAFSEIRESDSIVKARSGQVIVIGGLMRDQHQKQEFRTPYLGAIPGIGNLFKSKREATRKSELVILLRPVVINDDSQWANLATEPGSLREKEKSKD
jgi:MSHA biogenesis protein MshL